MTKSSRVYPIYGASLASVEPPVVDLQINWNAVLHLELRIRHLKTRNSNG